MKQPIPGANKGRYYDFVADDIFYEVKTGKVTLSNVRAQIAADAKWVEAEHKVVWVFVASEFSGIGPNPAVLTALENAGIQFEIHWPA